MDGWLFSQFWRGLNYPQTWGTRPHVLQQQRVGIGAQQTDGAVAGEPRQGGGSPLLILLPDRGQQLQDDRVAVVLDRVHVAGRCRSEVVRCCKVPGLHVVAKHGDSLPLLLYENQSPL